MSEWSEDQYAPRFDVLAGDFHKDSNQLPAAHPEYFRVGDIIRVGDDDRYDTGEVDEYGDPIFRVWNEAVRMVGVNDNVPIVERAVGINPAQTKRKGERLFIIGA